VLFFLCWVVELEQKICDCGWVWGFIGVWGIRMVGLLELNLILKTEILLSRKLALEHETLPFG